MPTSAVPCAVVAAKHNTQAILHERGRTFWAERATERAVIAFLVRNNITIRSVVDVGAASYLNKRGTAADEPSLRNIFRQLGNNVHYYGFEPDRKRIRGLQRAAKRDPHVPRGWRLLRSMRSSPNTRTTNQRLEGLHQYRHVGWVNATTLDIFTTLRSLSRIDFVKVNTEGAEREVVLFEGAAELLTLRRVRMILWEYGHTISADTFRTAKNRNSVPPSSPDAMHGPNLKRVTAELLAFGYRCLSVHPSSAPAPAILTFTLRPPLTDPQELLCGCVKVGPACVHSPVGTVLGRCDGGVSGADGQDLQARHLEHSCWWQRGRSGPRIARTHGLGTIRGRVQRANERRPPAHLWAQRPKHVAAFRPCCRVAELVDDWWKPTFRHRVLCEHCVE